MTFPPRMSVAEAAAYTGISASSLNKRRMASDGPPFLKLTARRVVYDATDLDRWLESKRRVSTSDPGDTSVAV